jgi:hypothetical protein
MPTSVLVYGFRVSCIASASILSGTYGGNDETRPQALYLIYNENYDDLCYRGNVSR